MMVGLNDREGIANLNDSVILSATPGRGHLPAAESVPEQGSSGRQDFPTQHNHFPQWSQGAGLTHQVQRPGKGKESAASVLLA